jgi:hypothetical protein
MQLFDFFDERGFDIYDIAMYVLLGSPRLKWGHTFIYFISIYILCATWFQQV